MKTTLTATAALLFALLLLLGCAAPPSVPSATTAPAEAGETARAESAPDTAVTLTDMTGRTVALDAPATRIVALAPGDCEILHAIGAGDTLVGRGEYCDYPEAAAAVTSVQTGSETNIEQILALAPEVVVLNTMAQTLEQVEALENAGIKTVASRATDIAGTYEAIKMLGTLTGHTEEAAALIDSMRAAFDELSESALAARGDGARTVYFEVSPLQYGLWTAGSGTFMDEIAGLLGLTNAFADVKDWVEISEEQVLERNPDVIVTISMYFGEGPTPEEEIMQRKGWNNVSAVQNGAVFTADNNTMARPGPRLVEAASALYAAVYGGQGTLAPAA